MSQNVANLSVNNVWKFQNVTVSSVSCFDDIKTERWAYINPDKSGHAFFWITEKC